MPEAKQVIVQKEECEHCRSTIFVLAMVEKGLLIICNRCKSIYKGKQKTPILDQFERREKRGYS